MQRRLASSIRGAAVRCLAAVRWTAAAGVLVAAAALPAAAQPPPAASAPALSGGAPAPDAVPVPGTTTFLVENMTRLELWRYFTPRPGGGTEPEYLFAGNRSSLGVSHQGVRWSAQGTLQYVRLENLPRRAIGPGLLGTGAAYFFQAAGTFSYQFYLRALTLGWRDRDRGAWIELGRLSRAADREAPSGDAVIDGLVRDELNGRLLGDMEWSFYQRAWDGVRGGVARGGLAATVTAALPTQGTFEESANLSMERVPVVALELAAVPGRLVRRTRLDAFAIRYDDTRPVAARPDNTEIPVRRVQVRVDTAGASLAGAYRVPGGTLDVVAWGAVQRGRWYGQAHGGRAFTASVGQRFTAIAWRPRLRAGVAWASGDASPFDGRHETFFPMLPSGDRLSRLNAYALMNVRDLWAAAEAAPSRAIDLRAAARRVSLARGTDRWYQGSGATSRVGNYFGFQGRDGQGSASIGTVLEGSLEWRPWRRLTLRVYAGRLAGGDVPKRIFVGERLANAWLESTVRF